jgi:hypothetical protein
MLVLEIGVGGYESERAGGSLRVWRDYFLRSRIVGVDLHPKQVQLGRRVAFRQADQSSSVELLAVVEEFGVPDIVIDDGSHIGPHVWASFDALFPLMPPGALYAIEDLHTSYWPDYLGGVPAPHDSAIALVQSLVGDAQAFDPTFRRWPHHERPPVPRHGVRAAHIYPGLAIVERADERTSAHAISKNHDQLGRVGRIAT